MRRSSSSQSVCPAGPPRARAGPAQRGRHRARARSAYTTGSARHAHLRDAPSLEPSAAGAGAATRLRAAPGTECRAFARSFWSFSGGSPEVAGVLDAHGEAQDGLQGRARRGVRARLLLPRGAGGPPRCCRISFRAGGGSRTSSTKSIWYGSATTRASAMRSCCRACRSVRPRPGSAGRLHGRDPIALRRAARRRPWCSGHVAILSSSQAAC